jgi:hypothetical protein
MRRICTLLALRQLPVDKRGKRTSGNSKPGLVVNAVMDHIRSYLAKRAHYASHEGKYLSEQLNTKVMHKQFMEKYPQHKDAKY